MSLMSYKHSQASVILRVKILDSSSTLGAGLTGLSSGSAGLIISTLADNEAAPTAYTVTAGNVETIATLGTYAAPSADKCRFKEVDATNHPGLYEIQLLDARFTVASAKSLILSVSGATNIAEMDALIPLTQIDPYQTIAAAVLAALVDGTVDIETALKRILAITVNNIAVVGSDPIVYSYKDDAGAAEVVSQSVPASGASRTTTTP